MRSPSVARAFDVQADIVTYMRAFCGGRRCALDNAVDRATVLSLRGRTASPGSETVGGGLAAAWSSSILAAFLGMRWLRTYLADDRPPGVRDDRPSSNGSPPTPAPQNPTVLALEELRAYRVSTEWGLCGRRCSRTSTKTACSEYATVRSSLRRQGSVHRTMNGGWYQLRIEKTGTPRPALADPSSICSGPSQRASDPITQQEMATYTRLLDAWPR